MKRNWKMKIRVSELIIPHWRFTCGRICDDLVVMIEPCSVSIYRRYINLHHLQPTPVRNFGQFENSVKGTSQIGQIFLFFFKIVSKKTSQNTLMTHNQHVLASFQFHNHRFQPSHQIFVGLTARIPVVILVIVSRFELFRVLLGYFFVSE